MSTGLKIRLEKSFELHDVVEYLFYVPVGYGGFIISSASGSKGVLRINKSTGLVSLVSDCQDDPGEGLLFSRAGTVLKRQWKLGKFPAILSWEG